MPILPLSSTPPADIVATLSEAFEGYFVQLPSDVAYWEARWKAARVDWDLSFGYFENDVLVGFIIQGIDQYNGKQTAFNTGTGVLPDFRGQGIVDQLYAHAMPIMRTAGIETCNLEVITQNERAIAVYRRIGFAIVRRLKCFRGELKKASPLNLQLRRFPPSQINQMPTDSRHLDSWDNCDAAILAGEAIYQAYSVYEADRWLGFFVINPASGYLPQCAIAVDAPESAWPKLLAAVESICPTIRINNIDERRTGLIDTLLSAGMENHIDQFEMAMPILLTPA
jgi:ribosomal protein S18 acetylase RimI-like enzyme